LFAFIQSATFQAIASQQKVIEKEEKRRISSGEINLQNIKANQFTLRLRNEKKAKDDGHQQPLEDPFPGRDEPHHLRIFQHLRRGHLPR